jgi:hypothetical protein
MIVFPRREWTATLPANAGVDLADEIDGLPNFVAKEVKGMAIHYFGSTGDLGHRDVRGVFEQARKQDMDVKHYSDIMYNTGVANNEAGVFELRGLVNKGAANGGTEKKPARYNNAQYPSTLCVLGATEKPTDTLFENLLWARQLHLAKYPDAPDVRPHLYFKPTSCPGEQVLSVCFNKDYSMKKTFWDQLPLPPANPAYVCPAPQVPLTEGAVGQEVYNLQALLAFFGYYNVTQDGVYGNITRWGVALLQNDLHNGGFYPYNTDGYYGPKTIEGWCKLLNVLWEMNQK